MVVAYKKSNDECQKCAYKILSYIDLSIDRDKQLQVLADLLIRQNGDGLLVEIGFAIDKYLQKKMICEAVFWGRDLRRCTLSDFEIEAEKYRLRHLLRH